MSGGEGGGWAAPLGDAAPPLLGALEGVTAEGLEGWLRDPARPLWPVMFRVSLGGADLGRHIANLPPHPDAPGRLRFRVPLPAGLAPEAARQAVILTLDGRRALTPEGWREQAPQGVRGEAPEPPRAALPRPDAPAAPEVAAAAPPAEFEAAATATPLAEAAPLPPSPPHELASLLDQLDPAQRLALVEKAFQAKEWPVVLALTENLPGTARDPRLVTFRGRAFFYQGRHAEAVETLRFIQARHPQRHTAMLFLGRALAQLGQLPEAREVLAHCRAGNPAEPRYVFEAGRIAARLVQGDDGQAEPRPDLREEAMSLLRQAFDLRPTDHRAPRLLAQLTLLEGRIGEALSLLETAVALAPQQAELRMELARLLTRLNRLEEALAAAEAAARLDPLRDGAAFAVRILQRWLEARRTGPLRIDEVAPA
jgi:tetratricopeptide (TPR) repeat protein